ncbi:MAG: hypothetical protein ACRDNZ_16240, partial [Streptosporangiaceae bacterium]
MLFSDQTAKNVASKLAFVFGDAEPYVQTGISLLFGIFSSPSSPPSPVTAQQVQDMLDNAVEEINELMIQGTVARAAADVNTFYTALQRDMEVKAPDSSIWMQMVNSLDDQFSYANFAIKSDLLQILSNDVLQ